VLATQLQFKVHTVEMKGWLNVQSLSRIPRNKTKTTFPGQFTGIFVQSWTVPSLFIFSRLVVHSSRSSQYATTTHTQVLQLHPMSNTPIAISTHRFDTAKTFLSLFSRNLLYSSLLSFTFKR